MATLHFDEGFDIERFGFFEPLVTDSRGVALPNVTSLVYLTTEAASAAPTPRPFYSAWLSFVSRPRSAKYY